MINLFRYKALTCSTLALLLILLIPFDICVARDISEPAPTAKAYLLMDMQSGQTLKSFESDKAIQPSSLTKLMTAYLVFRELKDGKISLNQEISVSHNGYTQEGSRMFLVPEQPAKLEDVIKGMLVPLGNDACVTLAETIAGSEKEFVQKMNDQAKRLGMQQTHFTNSTGHAEENHYSTVNDLAILSQALYRDFPEYYVFFGIHSFTYNGIPQPNRNTQLVKDENTDGLIVGYTEKEGYGIALSNKRHHRKILAIVMGASSARKRDLESGQLVEWGLQSFESPILYEAEQAVSKAQVFKGKLNEVKIGFLHPVYATVGIGKSQEISPVLETEQPVIAPIAKGQKIGVLKVYHQDKLLYEIPVVALEDVPEAGFFGRMWDSVKLWFNT